MPNLWEVRITPTCIKNRGREGAIDEALRLLKINLSASIDAWEKTTFVIGWDTENSQ